MNGARGAEDIEKFFKFLLLLSHIESNKPDSFEFDQHLSLKSFSLRKKQRK